jgi:hypothetical protein
VRRGRHLRHVLLGVAGAFWCAGSVPTGQAWADPAAAFSLVWSAPDGCPSEEQVRAEIARLLGGDLRLHEDGDLQAKVTVLHGSLWSADLATQQGGRVGRRSIEAASCQAVADGIALIIALSIDPDAVTATAEAPRREVPFVADVPANSKRQLRILASVHAQGLAGTLPGPDVGVGLGVGLAGARWRTELRWTYGLRRDQVASLASGASGRFNLAGGSLTECLDLGLTKLASGPCAVAEGGRVSVSGYGTAAGFSRHAPWLALGGGGFLAVPVGQHLRISLEVDVVAPLYRPDYVFDGVPGVVFRAPAVGGRARVDVSWHF